MDRLSNQSISGKPEVAFRALPENVLQFGTGVLLRALPDYCIDQANRQGVFNGRVVAVKSTDGGASADAFGLQDNLYTICIRGLLNGRPFAENVVSTALSRVLSAQTQWQEVLDLAANPALEIVVSNTTEVGIQLVREDIRLMPPASFPGKLLACLLARYQAFQGDPGKGLVIIPTELVPQNGALLRGVVTELAKLNHLDAGFMYWLHNACTFCNSLVDRIVPGRPSADKLADLQASLGYQDDLLTLAEPYCLWAVEGDAKVMETLSFRLACPEAVVVTPNIDGYRERKLRLLNGTHTLSCGLAHLAGFTTVAQAMEDPDMATFIEHLMLDEIAPSIPFPLAPGDAEQFGRQVLDRFRNPFVEHRWLSITVQYSAKMRMRNIPVLLEHYRHQSNPPIHFALGFAAFICFYRHPEHTIQDDQRDYLIKQWEDYNTETVVHNVLCNLELWGTDLTALPGFANLVLTFVRQITDHGAWQVLNNPATFIHTNPTA